MRLAESTWPDVAGLDRSRTLVVLPLAACEQHSHHLPTFTDALLCGAIAERLEASFPERILLAPVQWLGASDHHKPFGATLSLSAADHAELVARLAEPMLEEGFKRILLLNGHGGNIDSLRVALRMLERRFSDRFLSGASYWEIAGAELASLAVGPLKSMGHACEFETSMMLALRPELVRTSRIADDGNQSNPLFRGLFVAEDFSKRSVGGAIGYPTRASAERGRLMFDAIDRRLRELVQAILDFSIPSTRSRNE